MISLWKQCPGPAMEPDFVAMLTRKCISLLLLACRIGMPVAHIQQELVRCMIAQISVDQTLHNASYRSSKGWRPKMKPEGRPVLHHRPLPPRHPTQMGLHRRPWTNWCKNGGRWPGTQVRSLKALMRFVIFPRKRVPGEAVKITQKATIRSDQVSDFLWKTTLG